MIVVLYCSKPCDGIKNFCGQNKDCLYNVECWEWPETPFGVTSLRVRLDSDSAIIPDRSY